MLPYFLGKALKVSSLELTSGVNLDNLFLICQQPVLLLTIGARPVSERVKTLFDPRETFVTS